MKVYLRSSLPKVDSKNVQEFSHKGENQTFSMVAHFHFYIKL